MVLIPEPQPQDHRLIRQFNMLNARRQFAIPSAHQLLSDAYAILGGELERLRCLEDSDTMDAKQKLLVYKQSSAKAEALGRLVRALQVLRQEARLAACESIGGKPADELSDGEILQMLAAEAGPEVESLMTQYRERQQQAGQQIPKPQAYKRERGPLPGADRDAAAGADGDDDGWK